MSSRLGVRAAAHPRSRGENFGPMPKPTRLPGSSPLTRGKRLDGPSHVVHTGLIPAHAGKTSDRGGQTCPPAAHPRSRGENRFFGTLPPNFAGSSPLTRGKLMRGSGPIRAYGLIPAHAGKTLAGAGLALGFTAHPRSRGENSRTTAIAASTWGSSPLTRGKPSSSQRPH